MIRNILTIDVEEYFHVEGFSDVIDPRSWASYQSRVRPAMQRLFDLLDRHDARATFFVLGWIAERDPALVREIVSRGHEVASHGFWHQMADRQGPDNFRADVRSSRAILEAITGSRVLGYRAPSFSITKRTPWAHQVLAEEGYRYSSSVFPVRHDRYGDVKAPRTPWKVPVRSGGLTELPPLTLRVMRKNVGMAGGGYMRLFPVALVSRAIEKMNAQGAPGVLYLHPWEIDPEQPWIEGAGLSQFRHYVGLEKMEEKIRVLLAKHRFGSVAEFLDLPKQTLAPWRGLPIPGVTNASRTPAA